MPFLCMTAVVPSYMRSLILASSLNAGAKIKSQKRTDILEQLYAIHIEKGYKVDFHMGEIEQEANVALNVGSDTTAIGLRFTIYHTMKKPSIDTELMQELDQPIKDGRLRSPVRYAEANKFSHLCACTQVCGCSWAECCPLNA
ncbi:uncharacterized protein BCR38DRAFT_527141 [Pseudomassariella vexata]|uniref:Cytochrome P450 n=1 Tax=Pseudomassariella vexata TaxID=1141098 RepID=A0A1Y2DIV9_9PEZI|nr:uncharacterized protein BCR38DRAFT_527141 [Pseudomassariella vexata]ORY59163.1 hypothetical protein BCR38DRAFT_527141 [Pseudomassariella vexata]